MTNIKFDTNVLTRPDLFDPFFIGHHKFLQRLTEFNSHVKTPVNYPPYNIRKVDEDNFVIDVALAGWSVEDLDVSLQEGILVVKGSQEKPDGEYLYKGISNRDFSREFTLAETVQVEEVNFVNGVLSVLLKNLIPEEKKPKKFDINGVKTKSSKKTFLND
jgi:molecular chaperone IbpA